MVESLERNIGNRTVYRFFLDANGKPYSLGVAEASLDPEQYDALVAVGPGALRYLQSRVGVVPLLFGMVLNPENIITNSATSCSGVSLNIPIEEQFSALVESFPWAARVGVLFDPANNQAWFDRAELVAEVMGLEIIPLQVNRSNGRLAIDGKLTTLDALLFIPDKTIIYRTVIQYVIKQAVFQGIPTIGYNQFFLDSGTALSFIIDYEKIGQQVAEQIEAALVSETCQNVMVPAFETRINTAVWQALKLDDRQVKP